MRDSIMHYGTKRHSGRYPYGSGEDPYQHENNFLKKYEGLRANGMSELDMANELGMTTRQLRDNITWARAAQREFRRDMIPRLKENGMSNTEIATYLDTSEGTVRRIMDTIENPQNKPSTIKITNTISALENGVDNTGYLDISKGVETQLGISRNALLSAANRMVKSGEYYQHKVYVKRLNDPTKWTTVLTLTKNPDPKETSDNRDLIRSLVDFSNDGAQSIIKKSLTKENMVNLDRIKINYAEDGGADKDGLIEIRPGVKDLDLGASHYAQVRIGAGEDLYLKGMAAYTDSKFDDGVDIIFNTNKSKGTPVRDVLKKVEVPLSETSDPNVIFGTAVNKQRGAFNIINEEGDWNTWSNKLSSQFLSKQPDALIKERLDKTYKDIVSEYEEISRLTNPTVKQHLLSGAGGFIDGLSSKAKMLQAKGMPNTKNHVILPFPDMNPTEVYAPHYNDGDAVVLIRHPHGGKFEIPTLIVNNKNPQAKKVLGMASDAIGIHPSVASVLSGADFDGDTVTVIPNTSGQIKTTRPLKELSNFDPNIYKVDHPTITSRYKETQMGMVSNLITDMTLKGATDSELARAVKHSMVVIDSHKHNLDYKQSAIDNGISALNKRYYTRPSPSGKPAVGASTIISRSKRQVDIEDPEFKPESLSSGTNTEAIYVDYVKKLQGLRNTALKEAAMVDQQVKDTAYSKPAAIIYKDEKESLTRKYNEAIANKPKERQAQILNTKMYYEQVQPDMSKEDKKKLRARTLASARQEVGTDRKEIHITDEEWEAIQSRAVAKTQLKDILQESNMDRVRELATPMQKTMTPAKESRALALIKNGATYAEVANALGVSVNSINAIVNKKGD